MITYHPVYDKRIGVRLDGVRVGEIREDAGGWRYYPKGQRAGGEAFPRLSDCKRSLETDTEDSNVLHE